MRSAHPTPRNRARRLAAASAASIVLVLGTAGVASAQGAPADEHCCGTAPGDGGVDPGAQVGGAGLTRGSSLPITGSDVVGLLALGGGAVAVGSATVVASRRRATRTAT